MPSVEATMASPSYIADLVSCRVPHSIGRAADSITDEDSQVADCCKLPTPCRLLNLTERLAADDSKLAEVGLLPCPHLEWRAGQVGNRCHVSQHVRCLKDLCPEVRRKGNSNQDGPRLILNSSIPPLLQAIGLW